VSCPQKTYTGSHSSRTISHKYGVSIAEIKSRNRLRSSSRIYPGQNLLIWTGKPAPNTKTVAKAATTAPAVSTGGYRDITHVVNKGDSLWTISRKYGVSISSIKSWNRLASASRIYPGQNLLIRKKVLSLSKNATGKTTAQTGQHDRLTQEIWYTVRSGDTLWEIAKKYKVTIPQIQKWNKLDTRRPIHPGLRLLICQESALSA